MYTNDEFHQAVFLFGSALHQQRVIANGLFHVDAVLFSADKCRPRLQLLQAGAGMMPEITWVIVASFSKSR